MDKITYLSDLRRKIDNVDPRNNPDPDLTSIASRLHEMQIDYHLNSSVDEILLLLSEKFKGGGTGGEITWTPPDTFHRSTTKYWVKASDCIKLKCMLLPHLPILVPHTSTPPGTSSCSTTTSSLISSVYLDNINLDLFHSRLFREDGSSLVRIRWYGDKIPALDTWPSSPLPLRTSADPNEEDSTIFVEKKTHREAWTGELSSKERSPLMIKSLSSFLSGHGSFESHHHHTSTTSVSSLDCPYPQSPMCMAPPPSPSTSTLNPADDGKDAVRRRRAAFLR